MISKEAYVQWSLHYNLFWTRIMKEHAIFIEATMPPPGKQLALKADYYKLHYDHFLSAAIKLSNGVLPLKVLQSGQYYTQFTEEAERLAQQDTGIFINRELTLKEYDIEPYSPDFTVTDELVQSVSQLNQDILNLTADFIQFQADLLMKRSSCSLFTMMYNADIDHVLLEAKRYHKIISGMQGREESAEDYKLFWTQNMAGHAKVMRGLLDPTETEYFKTANQFSDLFDTLAQNETVQETVPSDNELITDTMAIRNFKADTTQGIIRCKVQAIMLALYTDHLLREANHFLCLMQ